MVKFIDCFKEQLSPLDRIKVPDVRIVPDLSKNVTPKADTRPYDTPDHLHEAIDTDTDTGIGCRWPGTYEKFHKSIF